MNRQLRESLTLWAFSGCSALFFSMWLPWFRPRISASDLAGFAGSENTGEWMRQLLAGVTGQAPVASRVLMGIDWPVPVFLLSTVAAGVLVTLRTSGWYRPPARWISGSFLLGASGVAAWCVRTARDGAAWEYGAFVALAGAIMVFSAWIRFHFPSRRQRPPSP